MLKQFFPQFFAHFSNYQKDTFTHITTISMKAFFINQLHNTPLFTHYPLILHFPHPQKIAFSQAILHSGTNKAVF